jgi:hypothetical protein
MGPPPPHMPLISQRALRRFVVDDPVSFLDKRGLTPMRRMTRLNPKSASAVTTEGAQWTISPDCLCKEL